MFAGCGNRPVLQRQLVLISYRMGMQRYAGDRAVIGKTITLDGKPFRICGVMPSHFRVLGDPDVWTTLALDADPARRKSHILRVTARRKMGVTPDQASADMTSLARVSRRWLPIPTAAGG